MPPGPKTVSDRWISPSSCIFIMPAAVMSFDTDAILRMFPGVISTASDLSSDAAVPAAGPEKDSVSQWQKLSSAMP